MVCDLWYFALAFPFTLQSDERDADEADRVSLRNVTVNDIVGGKAALDSFLDGQSIHAEQVCVVLNESLVWPALAFCGSVSHYHLLNVAPALSLLHLPYLFLLFLVL